MEKQFVHLKAPDNWINDPNGFIYYKGMYHLFYQYFPYGPRWGTMHWGHAVSRDLVEWEHKGIALFPSVRGDQNGCFSGSAVEAEGKLVLVYTGVRYEVADPEDIHRSLDNQFESCQMMIASEDGFGFDNWKGKEVIIPPLTDPSVGHRTDTRDPKIWRGRDAWYLVVGSRTRQRQGKLLFYRSEDLHQWTFVNQAMKGPGYGWMWECPDYFEAGDGGVLVMSAMGLTEQEGMQENHSICFPVTFRESDCRMEIPDQYQFLDYGLDLYAPQTTLDAAGRRVLVAWLRMPEPTEEGWIGMFCSPRVVEQKDGHIYFRMHPDVRKAYGVEAGMCGGREETGRREMAEEPEAAGKPVRLALPGQGCRLLFSLDEGQHMDIGGFLVGRRNGCIYTDRSSVFPADAGAHLVSVTPPVQDGWNLEVLVDASLVEVFVNDGEYTISNAVYGLGKDIQGDGPVQMWVAGDGGQTSI
ncbi:MAG: glycoside hydrolase family 32 protein [Lachnospiraceae bacterium]|nr:glycoside hydrolase family 32 protein [Lachnospiraceae bacterium]